MRLAFVTVGDVSRRTGGHLYNARVLDGLRERGVEVKELSVCEESPEAQRAAAPSLEGLVEPGEFDVVAVDALARIVCAPHLDRWREVSPVLAMIHELPSVARRDDGERAYEEPLLRADRFVCVSGHGAGILESRGVSGANIHVVAPGLYRDPAREPRARREPREDGLRVLCVAQWIPRKGVLELVEAWKRRRKGEGAVLELVGDTDADAAYTGLVHEAVAGAEGVIVRGSVSGEELERRYAAADVFALPSSYEGYGMVYTEAMSHGLPLVACSAGPVPEIVAEAGILVPPADTEELARALDSLLSNETLRREMSEASLSRARRLARWETTVDGFQQALEAAVSRRRDS